MAEDSFVVRLQDVDREWISQVGGKNASLGELLKAFDPSLVRVPEGFATTAGAYRLFLAANGLERPIRDAIKAYDDGDQDLRSTGETIRSAIQRAEFPAQLGKAISEAYEDLSRGLGRENIDVAVRSSATAEDLPEASFAGQQETFLHVRGTQDVLEACRNCMASLFTDRAIVYRQNQGFDHLDIALSVGIQRMVRSDLGAAGVMFTIDTDTGFPGAVMITGAWGLGETVVQGITTPDQFIVFKPLVGKRGLLPIVGRTKGEKDKKLIYGHARPTKLVRASIEERAAWVLDDVDVVALAEAGIAIERHYGCPMDIEWAKDGLSGELFIVQARPETVQARRAASALRHFTLKRHGSLLVSGMAIGDAIATGPVCRIDTPQAMDRFVDHAVLVTSNTDPDWVPIMKRAAAIVTDHGGRTSHAAIVSRELGLPAVVGTGNATKTINSDETVTVSCAEGEEGHVYRGPAEFDIAELELKGLPSTNTQVMLNLANPLAAMRWWRLPADGVGLARMEFIISSWIRAHPMALAMPDRVSDPAEKRRIAELIQGYSNGEAYFVEQLASGIAELAMAYFPKPMILRTSDFKTNEYADLIGGSAFEPLEANPMLGFRGASRYYSDRYRPGFLLELHAIKRAREVIGFDNVVVMIPFCRTLGEADRVLAVMAEAGLERGRNGLEVFVMCEIPSNVILADGFAERFDGFSIGSNDLTQLTLGIDRDSELLAEVFDENDPALRWMIETVIERAHQHGRKVGFCGQRPSNDPAFAGFLVDAGIDSISVTPDSFVAVKQAVAAAESGTTDRYDLDQSPFGQL